MFRVRTSLVAFALSSFIAPAALAQTVWQVAPSGPITQIQEAVDLASDGDVILVEPGEYARLDIHGKSLTIVAEQGASVKHVVIEPFLGPPDRALDVSGLGPDQYLVLRGLHVSLTYLEPYPAVWLQDCDGAIAFEDCEFVGSSGSAVQVDACESVSFTRSIVGPGGPFLPAASNDWVPGPGLRVRGGNVHLFDTRVVGGHGHDVFGFFDTVTSDGGPALDLAAGVVFAAGSILEGGRGGQTDPNGLGGCYPMGDGAPAYRIDDLFGPSRLVLFDVELLAGAGGLPEAGCPEPSGAPGSAPVVLGGDVVHLAGDRRTFGVAPLWHEGGIAEAAYFGQAGDAVLLFASAPSASSVLVEPLALVGFVDPSAFVFQLRGVAPAGGVLFDALPVPALPVGVDALPLVTQAAFVDTTGALFASGPSYAVVVDAAP